jgi:hypothetical protein
MDLPDKIGRYLIVRELGRGMMGVVYEAHDPALGRRIALKTIRLAFAVSEEERRGFEARFLSEARIAARLSHPGIVVVHDVGQDAESGLLYIALEYLTGRTLSEVVAEGRPSDWREALRITKGVAEALHHAHSAGVIHRDVKPANIMILASGAPKIMDFGIAKVDSSQLTAAGQFFGTPLYMSPEQALGRPLDARSDLFSLGAMAYWLLTGQQAFAASAVPHIITRVIQEHPATPTRIVAGLPPDLDYFVARALAKDPADRYPDGRAMAEDAEDILSSMPPRHRSERPDAGAAGGTLVSATRQAPGKSEGPAPARGPAVTTKPASAAAPQHPGRSPLASRAARQRTVPWAAVLAAAVLGVVALTIGIAVLRKPAASSAMGSTASSESVPVDGEAQDAADQPAQLVIDFEHTLEYGTLRVWVDDAPVIDADLSSRVTRKLPGLELRKGRVEKTFELSPGMHEVRVQVVWADNVKTKRIAGHFAGGAVRRLSASLGGGVKGFVKKDLKLEWE